MLAVLGALVVALLVTYSPEPAWCRPGAAGQIALETEVRAYVQAVRTRSPEEARIIEPSDIRASLLKDCG